MSSFRSGLCLAALWVVGARLTAQCPDWRPGFERGGTDGAVYASATFDDGQGPRLFVGGFFAHAFDVQAWNIAAWNGATWSALPGVPSTAGPIKAMVVFDDGNGPALYVGGRLGSNGPLNTHGVARWNGVSWTPIAELYNGQMLGADVRALAVYRENGVDRLFAAGTFETLSGTLVNGVARWDGSAWTALGSGLGAGSSFGIGFALAVFDDGSGPALYVGGNFGDAGGTPAASLARWDGTSWSAVGGGVAGGAIYALASYANGGAPELYAGGYFSTAGGAPYATLARWNGATWNPVGGGVTGAYTEIDALAVFDDGAGLELYCGGVFSQAVNSDLTTIDSPNIARWNGSTWEDVDGGIPLVPPQQVCALTPFGSALSVAGTFEPAGDVFARNIGLYRGGAWRSIGRGRGLDDTVHALLAVDDAALERGLYAAGEFQTSGSGQAEHVARWDGTDWHSLGDGVDATARALALFDDGSGNALYVGGSFSHAGGVPASGITKWDGAGWSPLGSGVSGQVLALKCFDDGSGRALYVGGVISSAGGIPVTAIARWNGASWSSVGDPFSHSSGATVAVNAFEVFDDGSGSALYAGGNFTHIGTANVNFIARWDGTQWSPLGALQLSNEVRALAADANVLYVSGRFAFAGGNLVRAIARWDGVNWFDMGAGIQMQGLDGPNCLMVRSEAAGSVLYAGGGFGSISGVSANRVARWDGNWSALGAGASWTVRALANFDDGSGPAIFAGGEFTGAGNRESQHVARWYDPCACSAKQSYCTAGTTTHGCVPLISALGTASASATSGFTLQVVALEGQTLGHFAYSITGPNANPWGAQSSSFLCIKAPTQRTPTLSSQGTPGACDGLMSLDWSAYVASHPGCLGSPFSAGSQVWAQLYFRDPPAPKTTNLSAGLQFTLCP